MYKESGKEPHNLTEGHDPWPEAPGRRPLIPDGDYNALCVNYEIIPHYKFNNTPKVHLTMKVFYDPDNPDSYIELTRFLNYSKKPPPGSDYYTEWVKANNGHAPARGDRMSPEIFVGKKFKVRVRKVTSDKDGDPHEGDLRYSRVAKILRLEE